MAVVTFDTLKFVETLEKAGVSREQASAFAAAVRDSHEMAELVTKKDLQLELAPMKADLLLLKWMLGLVIAGIASLVLKAFF